MADDFSYSFNAKRIKVKQKDNGDYRFTFKVGHSSNVSSLSKRPARQTYYFTISHFEKEFDSFFPGSKPNASLNFWDKGESQIMVHKIKSMKVNKKSKVIIDIDPLQLLGSFETLPELLVRPRSLLIVEAVVAIVRLKMIALHAKEQCIAFHPSISNEITLMLRKF